MLADPFTCTQPYKGRWDLSCSNQGIGAVKGDTVVGFMAQDQLGRTLGTYRTSQEAMDAVVFVSEERVFIAAWLLESVRSQLSTRDGA